RPSGRLLRPRRKQRPAPAEMSHPAHLTLSAFSTLFFQPLESISALARPRRVLHPTPLPQRDGAHRPCSRVCTTQFTEQTPFDRHRCPGLAGATISPQCTSPGLPLCRGSGNPDPPPKRLLGNRLPRAYRPCVRRRCEGDCSGWAPRVGSLVRDLP